MDNNAASLYSLALTQERTHAAVLSGLCLCLSLYRLTHGVPRSLCLALFRPSVLSVRRSVRPCFSLSPRVISLLSYPFRARPRCGTTPPSRHTRAWTRSFANGVSALFCIVYLPLGELCDVAAHARARGRPLFSRAKFTRCYISAQDCTPVNTSTVTTLVFGMPGMAQRIWTTHTPAAQPVCAHADTA